jgi:hypothetical protein
LTPVKPSENEEVHLLDNHDTSFETAECASEVVTVMVTFSPHTSNKWKSLDLIVYGSFKTFYNHCSSNVCHLNNAQKTFDTYCLTEVLGTVYPGAFGMGNILSRFKVAGIFQPDRCILRI